MNKKIGVCCVFDHRNYGSMLQTLATIEKLEQMGYDYEIIHYTKKLTLDLLLRSLDRIPEEIKTRVHSMNKNKKMDTYPEIKDSIKIRNSCTFRINGAPFPRQRCKRLAPAVRYPFVVTC